MHRLTRATSGWPSAVARRSSQSLRLNPTDAPRIVRASSTLSPDDFASQAIADDANAPATEKQPQNGADNRGKPESAPSEPQQRTKKPSRQFEQWFERGALSPKITMISQSKDPIRKVDSEEKEQMLVRFVTKTGSSVKPGSASPVPTGRYMSKSRAGKIESERPPQRDTDVVRAIRSTNVQAAPGSSPLGRSPDLPKRLVRYHGIRSPHLEDFNLRVIEFSGLPASTSANTVLWAIRNAAKNGWIDPRTANVQFANVIHKNPGANVGLVIKVGFYDARGARQMYELGEEGYITVGEKLDSDGLQVAKMSLCQYEGMPDASISGGQLGWWDSDARESWRALPDEKLAQGTSKADDMPLPKDTEEEDPTGSISPVDGIEGISPFY